MMPRSLAVFIGTLLVFLFSSAHANFYVIAGGGKKVGTEIKALPYIITEPGFYYITKNLSCVSGVHGITINTSDVTIDLMGFSLIGPGGAISSDNHGIYSALAVRHLEIRNGVIQDFQGDGILIDHGESRGCKIVNIKAASNRDEGIDIDGFLNIVRDCICTNNTGYGIDSIGKGTIIKGNSCYGNGDGIFTGSGHTITGNLCYQNIDAGIHTGGGCIIQGNTCSGNSGDGIIVGSGAVVIGNACNINAKNGIWAFTNCYIDQNNCYGNETNMRTGSDCTFGNNHAPK
ncbi:MAG: hypothetical protein D3926_05035 [Desulfobacteraceae bacterium]|nr:MAG: hypothetical protein D3926_05035 [Desulfobacteraceae bacterium]